MILQETKVYVTTRKMYTLLTTFWDKIFLKFKRFEQCDHVDFLNECSFWYHFSSLIKKDVFACHKLGTKKILSPHEESNLRPSDSVL